MPSNEIQKLLTDFLNYLEIERGRSLYTIKNYEFYLTRFIKWSKITSPAKIDMDLVREFRLWLNRLSRKDRTLKKSTQNYHLIALRAFLKYLTIRDIKTMAPEKIELAKMPQRQVEFLEGSDLERLLTAPLQTDDKKIIQTRDKAILELFFSTGLRVSELASIKRENVNFKKDEFTIRGKGSKLRIVFMSNQAKHWVKEYLNKRSDPTEWLFIRHDKAKRSSENKGKHTEGLTPRSIQRLVQKYTKRAGITKHVSPHTLRHSFATDLLKGGADIREVQAMLGHASITTTQVYTHITDKHLSEIHKKYHGKSIEDK